MDWLGELSAVHWLAITAILGILEITTGTLYILFVAAAALIVAGLNWLGPDLAWETDLALFGFVSTLSLLVGHFVVKPRLADGADEGLNDPARAMIGRRARAIADFQTGEGRVQLGDTQWRARTDDMIEAGEELVVVAVEGSTLRVEAWDGEG